MSESIVIPNIENYIQEIIDGSLILTPKKIFITENELNITQIINSKIEECVIKKGEDVISTKTKYRSILVDIWKTMPTQKILQNTDFNFKLTEESGIDGYEWCRHINMSFQSKNASGTLKEIVKMVKINNMSIILSIKLETGKVIYFKI